MLECRFNRFTNLVSFATAWYVITACLTSYLAQRDTSTYPATLNRGHVSHVEQTGASYESRLRQSRVMNTWDIEYDVSQTWNWAAHGNFVYLNLDYFTEETEANSVITWVSEITSDEDRPIRTKTKPKRSVHGVRDYIGLRHRTILRESIEVTPKICEFYMPYIGFYSRNCFADGQKVTMEPQLSK